MENKSFVLQKKWYLYLTEFFSGMAVMAVELGASRLLAPYFSSSQIVWTIIIGTIMIAMALGNVYGGRSADKNPNPDKLYGRICIAAIWIAAIPVVGKYLILGISAILIFSINENFLIWAAFAACMVIFVFPLFLLGTVTPSLVKYSTDSLEDNGKTVGTLTASNTIGSILGTFLPTFVTIPSVGTSITFFIFAGILLLLSLLYFISSHCGKKKMIFCILFFLVCCIFGHNPSFAFWEKELAYEGESVYNYLQVKESEEDVILSTNVLFGVQSILKKEEGLTGMYYDYAMFAPFMADIMQKDTRDILVLGMGTGTFARQCSHYFEDVTIHGVEIDKKITDLASKYFALPEDIKVTAYDGRAYLQADKKQYDVIMVDAYQDITIPFQMSSIEFFTLVKEHLKDTGVMVVNMNMRGQKEGNINQYLSDTVANVFDFVYTVDVEKSTNRELFACSFENALEIAEQNIELLQQKDFLESSSEEKEMVESDLKSKRLELAEMMIQVKENLLPYQKGTYLLTDDIAPVELLGMQVIDDIIRDEILYYKDMYKKEGWKGLLNNLTN